MFKRKRIIIVVVFCLIIIVFQLRNRDISDPFKGLIGNLLNPLVYLVSNGFSGVSSVWNSYINLIDVQEENSKMKDELNRLSLENSLIKERLLLVASLETLLKFNQTFDFETVPANVIGINTGYIKNLIIDRGSIDGVNKDDPVIGFKGLVGRVSEIYLKSSKVELILAASSNVSVINNRTRAVGIMRGDGAGDIWVDFYDRLDNVSIGDTFITSGLGKLFPKGITVGDVSNISKDNVGLFQKIYLDKVEDFYKLENIFILKNFKE